MEEAGQMKNVLYIVVAIVIIATCSMNINEIRKAKSEEGCVRKITLTESKSTSLIAMNAIALTFGIVLGMYSFWGGLSKDTRNSISRSGLRSSLLQDK